MLRACKGERRRAVNTSTIGVLVLGVLLAGVSVAWAHEEAERLPAGPIRQRHELMENLGSRAKEIGNAIRSGTTEGVAENAESIRDASKKIPGLFPRGSTDPKSRANELIWKEWSRFERSAQTLTDTAATLAEAARSGRDVGQASRQMSQACKGCHEAFRQPEE
jgi:cytochrome c556